MSQIATTRDFRWPVLWLITLAVGLLLAPSVLELHQRWMQFDQAYSHGYLLLAASLYFVYLQRHRINTAVTRSNTYLLVLLLGCALLWGLAQLLGVALVGQLLLPVILALAIGATLGLAVLRPFLFPLALIYLAIPFWEDLFETPLRDITTAAVTFMLRGLDFPAYIDGYRIDVPEGSFYVAGGCSGLSFFLTGIAISTSFGFLNFTSWRRKIAFVVICVIASLISNWIRVFALVLIGHYTAMQSSLIGGEGHLTFGWYVFAGALVLLIALGFRMARGDPIPDFGSASAPRGDRIPIMMLVASLLVASAGTVLTAAYQITAPNNLTFALPNDARQPEPSQVQWQPDFPEHDAAIDAEFDIPADSSTQLRVNVVQLAIRAYRSQRQGAEVISNTNEFVPHQKDSLLLNEQVNVPGLAHPVRQLLVRTPQGARLIRYWYNISGEIVIEASDARLAQLRGLTTGRTDGTVIAFSILCGADCDEASVQLDQVMSAQAAATNALVERSIDLARSHQH